MKCGTWTRVLAAVFLTAGAVRSAEVVTADARGTFHTLLVGEEYVPFRAYLYLPSPGWKQLVTQNNAKDVRLTASGNRRTWSGRIETEPGRFCRFDQTVQEVPGAVSIGLTVTAETDVSLEGIYWWMDIPISMFGGGKWELRPEKAPAEIMILPHKQAPINPLVSGSVRQVLLADAPREVRVDISLDRICTINLQDNRTYGSATYGALVECFKGPLGKGKSASLQVSLGLSSQPVTGQTVLTLHPAQKRYELEGFGGNYCFGIESPVATYTLRNLRSVWARSEMLLREWEPENDNASASQVNWEYFKAQDKPGSKLRRRFLFDQQIQKQGLRQVVSIWQLPNWLYTDPARQTDDHGRRLAPDKWAELLESIGSYLLHAKRAYGVEPDLFSFNEADLGVYVQFSAEEQRDMIKRVGTILQKLGLKTKLLVADSHSPRDTSLYALPTADDPQALSFAGGLSFHSWGGASAAQYKAWADLAGRLRLPLIVAEAGLDPEVWRTGMFDTYPYGLSEARMYQELLLHARPQAILYWEYTSDYRLVREKNAGAAKEPELTPTARFWFLKHFSDLTPPKAAALTTGSSQSDVLLTAFAGSGKDASALTLHILNTGAARQAAIFGVPVTVTTLRAVLTSDGQSFQELPPVAVIKVPLVVDLPARSLLTLTTLAK